MVSSLTLHTHHIPALLVLSCEKGSFFPLGLLLENIWLCDAFMDFQLSLVRYFSYTFLKYDIYIIYSRYAVQCYLQVYLVCSGVKLAVGEWYICIEIGLRKVFLNKYLEYVLVFWLFFFYFLLYIIRYSFF